MDWVRSCYWQRVSHTKAHTNLLTKDRPHVMSLPRRHHNNLERHHSGHRYRDNVTDPGSRGSRDVTTRSRADAGDGQLVSCYVVRPLTDGLGGGARDPSWSAAVSSGPSRTEGGGHVSGRRGTCPDNDRGPPVTGRGTSEGKLRPAGHETPAWRRYLDVNTVPLNAQPAFCRKQKLASLLIERYHGSKESYQM